MEKYLTLVLFVLFLSGNIKAQWYQQNSGATVDLLSVFFINENSGWVCGDSGKIIKTTNGGLDWVEQNSNTIEVLKAIQFVDQDNGWAYGSNQILQTTNGGSDWSLQQIPPPAYIITLQFIDLNTGWMLYQVSDTISVIRKTVDGGGTWTIQYQSSNEHYGAMFFLNANYGWISTLPENPIFPGGGVLKTTDGGDAWNFNNADFFGPPMCIKFVDQMTGWISHNQVLQSPFCAISKSTDSGVTWDMQSGAGLRFIYSISFPSTNIGYAAGLQWFLPPTSGEGLILRTTNGGTDWSEQFKDDGELKSIFFINDTVGWAVGNGGKILVTLNGGVSSVGEEENQTNPNDFLLYQNYPNPFNPSTSIQYAIRSRQFVTLKVYDILGNEIATLVNEEKPAGEYEVTFDSHSGKVRNLTSGIYFYQLKAGSYIGTKKMILIK